MRYLIDRCATRIVAISQATMTAAWGPEWRRDARAAVIYGGIDTRRFNASAAEDSATDLALPRGANCYIHVGNFVPAKNHLRLLSIFAEIARRDQNAYLVLAGRGENEVERQAKAMVKQDGLESRVVFAGVRRDVPRLLVAAHTMIFPSLWEGLAGAVLEASAAGLPVIASDLPAFNEITGYLPLLRCVSLAVPDARWADAAQAAVMAGQTPAVRDQARQRFAMSPFLVEKSALAYQALWRGDHKLPTFASDNRTGQGR
jgi:glycosyltransferase involved in cell wall biosynthesis